MANDDPVKKAMADSHKLMDRMNNSNLPKQSMFAPKPTQFSGASYSMAHKPVSTSPAATASDAAEGIKNRQANVQAYEDASKKE